MRRYSRDDEERIRAQTQVREWTRSGLLDSSQRARLEAELRVDVKRTNVFLRAGLALFTGLIVGASVLLAITGFNLERAAPVAAVTAVAALACIGLAEALIGRLHFYRFGVEEALAVAAVLLFGISGAACVAAFHIGPSEQAAFVTPLVIGAAGGFGVYRRFGYVYAAVGAMACAAAIPFQFPSSATTQHFLAAAILAMVSIVARLKRSRYGDDYPGDDYGQLQAAAWAGLYLTLNVHIGWWQSERIVGWFYWCTYVMTWVLPITGLAMSIRDKDRALMDISIVMVLATLATNKPYLGSPRQTWDPILLGVFLTVLALALRRWLAAGPGGERHGFTPARLLEKDHAILALLSATSASVRPDTHVSPPDPIRPEFGGGSSGGGGGGATY